MRYWNCVSNRGSNGNQPKLIVACGLHVTQVGDNWLNIPACKVGMGIIGSKASPSFSSKNKAVGLGMDIHWSVPGVLVWNQVGYRCFRSGNLTKYNK